MIYCKKTVLFVFYLLLLGVYNTSNVYALGQLTEENWHGVSSDSFGYDSDSGYEDDYILLRPLLDATASTSVLEGAAWSSVSPYSMHGYLDSSIARNGYSDGAIFDEVFFETGDKQPASLNFNFDFNFNIQVVDTSKEITDSNGWYDSSILVQFWADHNVLDKILFNFTSEEQDDSTMKYFVKTYKTNDETPDSIVEMENGTFNYSDTISFATNGWMAEEQGIDGLVGSGTFLPFTIDLWTESYDNLIIDYANSFVIDENNPYNAYDANGNLLDPTSYSLSSPENFTLPANTPVPEPATLILLGSGLAGLAFYRRKRK